MATGDSMPYWAVFCPPSRDCGVESLTVSPPKPNPVLNVTYAIDPDLLRKKMTENSFASLLAMEAYKNGVLDLACAKVVEQHAPGYYLDEDPNPKIPGTEHHSARIHAVALEIQ